ncbi:hypothetical protein AMECASPLE_032040 [Ameca splendens]|uniref:Uncharacterized protein n=1 Tax=Ameca splendens TaxID=208324 RepID=A0ABV0XVC1_9TELE
MQTSRQHDETPGVPTTTASSVKQQTSQSAFLLAVGGCATVSSFSVMGFLVLLYKWKTRTIANGSDKRTAHTEMTYENWAPGCRFEESTYQSLNPASMDQEPAYLILT